MRKNNFLIISMLSILLCTILQADDDEIRVDFINGSGRTTLTAESDNASFINRGISVLLAGKYPQAPGVTRSDYLYIGLNVQKWIDEYDAESNYFAGIFGGEIVTGSNTIKFVYGLGLGIGYVHAKTTGIESLFALEAEPYIGLKWLVIDNLNMNFRVGIKGYAMEDSQDTYSDRSGNEAYTINAQIGIGFIPFK